MEASIEMQARSAVYFGRMLWRYFGLATMVAISLTVLVLAFQLGLANVYSYALRNWHERWLQDYSHSLSEQNVLIAELVSQQMLAWRHDDPLYLTLAAKQVEWRNFYQLVISSEDNKAQQRVQNLAKAYSFYQQAANLRPTWPDTYVALASNRQAMGEPATVWFAYLAQGVAVAPKTKASLLGMVNLGIANWERLDPLQQQVVESSLVSLLENPAINRKLKREIPSALVRDRICYLLTYQGSIAQAEFCKAQSSWQ
ncbi:hypothetical protein ACRRS0_09465 [Agarivorans sp. QJM3NY_29]|uniref:hypothetical protein n=1 Tax=unclassified Agarivorans TaxID=2636026 RepID=UPI003D7DE234